MEPWMKFKRATRPGGSSCAAAKPGKAAKAKAMKRVSETSMLIFRIGVLLLSECSASRHPNSLDASQPQKRQDLRLKHYDSLAAVSSGVTSASVRTATTVSSTTATVIATASAATVIATASAATSTVAATSTAAAVGAASAGVPAAGRAVARTRRAIPSAGVAAARGTVNAATGISAARVGASRPHDGLPHIKWRARIGVRIAASGRLVGAAVATLGAIGL